MIGNRAMQRFFARPSRQADPFSTAEAARGTALQRQPTVTLDPVVIANDPATQRQLQAHSDQMMRRFPEVWRGFCRDWHDASLGALSSVPDLANPFEARNFWKALAGNLAWAATSIAVVGAVSGAGAVVVITGSVLGAGAGTGVFQQAGPPSGRETLARVLADERDSIERRGSRSVFANVALRGLSVAADDPEAQDRMLWHKFSSLIPFESRAGVMLRNAQARLGSWLSQYRQQYLEWKQRDDVIAKARDYELAENVSGPYGSPWDITADLLGIGTPADRFFELAMQDIPLRLVLTG